MAGMVGPSRSVLTKNLKPKVTVSKTNKQKTNTRIRIQKQIKIQRKETTTAEVDSGSATVPRNVADPGFSCDKRDDDCNIAEC